ncbi:type B 50S ribosomal protein L31 [Candidatus Zinderia endosymbiont of Aphrophora alni]|uniref:type B 50S ribosomal protein L31 n=1 Tax=Candidatus Zinderia endosymbiont of Aphrophora alni TaxID=3077951 RepID=UPI0030CCEA33
MKKNIHPIYRYVVFYDVSINYKFIIKSSIKTKKKINFNGINYPFIKIEVSSKSHPFYTGKNKILDISGRVENFKKKFNYIYD